MNRTELHFIGCVECERYHEDDGTTACCGTPVYGVTIPLRPDNMDTVIRARLRERDWKRSRPGGDADGRETR